MGQTKELDRAARWLKPETLLQSIGIGLVMTALSRIAGLGRAVVFARCMSREELGTWSIANNTMQLIAVVLVFGIPGGVSRYVARYQQEGRLRLLLVQASKISLF